MFETPNSVINNNFVKVKELAKEIAEDLTVLLGAEIYYTNDVPEKLETQEYLTLAGTKYALVEFSYSSSYSAICTAISNIMLAGFIPVIAHIERYNCLYKSKGRVEELRERGCLVQVNAESVMHPKLLGDILATYKRRVKYLLKRDLVHFVASDVHNMTSRKNYMALAYRKVCKEYGDERARHLFFENQAKLLKGVF